MSDRMDPEIERLIQRNELMVHADSTERPHRLEVLRTLSLAVYKAALEEAAKVVCPSCASGQTSNHGRIIGSRWEDCPVPAIRALNQSPRTQKEPGHER